MRTFSVEINRRLKLAKRFCSSLDTHLETVVERYRENMTRVFGESVNLPDVREQLVAAKEMVLQLKEELEAANLAHLEELADEHHLIVERDDLTRRLAEKLRSLRSVCEGAYGRENLHQLGLGEPPPRNAAVLYGVGELVDRRLRSENLDLPEPRVKGVAPGPELAESLKPELEELGTRLEKIESEDRASEKSLIRKYDATTNFDTFFILFAQLGATIYRLAGMEEEAKRIRPKVRQVRGVEQIDTDSVPDDDTEPVATDEPAVEPTDSPVP